MFIHLCYQDVVINGIQRALNIQEYDTIQFTISIFSSHHYTFGYGTLLSSDLGGIHTEILIA